MQTPAWKTPAVSLLTAILKIAALYSIPALMCLYFPVVSDSDIWWHLRSAEWIQAHHAFPHTDPFSLAVNGKPWADYTWLFDLIIYQLYTRLGLIGIVAYITGMVLAITLAIRRMVQRFQPSINTSLPLSLAAAFCLWHLLLQARATGKTRGLFWLPLIFALWANLHIQFINGLIVLGFAVIDCFIGPHWTRTRSLIHPATLYCFAITSVLATFANPYGWHIYKVAYDLASQSGVFYELAELQAMPFRDLADYGVLFFGVAAATVIFRTRRFQLFDLLLIAFAFTTSFRCKRDLWVLVISSTAILAASLPKNEDTATHARRFAAPIAAAVTAIALFIGAVSFHFTNAQLETSRRDKLPVQAVEAIQRMGLTGPLYNHYDWGGYLMWSLRLPVTIDGRAGLYGDQRYFRNIGTWSGAPDWNTDPQLSAARLVIGPTRAPLTQILRMDPRYQLAYEDKLATVFTRR
jgi:hypothetical protein